MVLNMSAANNLNSELLTEDINKVDSPVQTDVNTATPESKSNCDAPNAPPRAANRRINHAGLVIPTIVFPAMTSFQVNLGGAQSNTSPNRGNQSVLYTTPERKIGNRVYTQK
jgi:hypothetical protein